MLTDLFGSKVPEEWDPPLNGHIYASGRSRLPGLSEDSLELMDLIAAVERADGTFRFVSAGCGYGRWLVTAATVCGYLKKTPVLTGYEADPNRAAQARVNLRGHGASGTIIEGAVGAKAGKTFWRSGADFGQRAGEGDLEIQVYALDLSQPTDFLTMDIQGEELNVLKACDLRQVKMAHISTHSSGIHRAVGEMFDDLGWRHRYDIKKDASLGVGKAVDGIHSWSNYSQ